MNKRMKYLPVYFTTLLLLIIVIGCSSSKQLKPVSNAPAVQEPLHLYEVLPDEQEKKSLVGFLTREQVTTDTAFDWYQTNLKYFRLDSTTVQSIRAKKDKIHLVLFMGTWCHDSQQLVPKYFETLKAANFKDENLTIIGTDRNKKTIEGLHHLFNLQSVPTMIVLQNGIEIGRVVEYGSTTFVDKELGELVQKAE